MFSVRLLRRFLCILGCFASLPLAAQNLQSGKEINEVCAGCHGKLGEGGKRGEYPRIAGQRAAYLEEQLRSFRARKRINLPMFPYTQERELSDADIEDVSAFLAEIKLQTSYPDFKPTDDALTRLTAMEKVMIIPRAPGDLAKGQAHYEAQCMNCHARTGLGRSDFPMLVGQYTHYLMKQMVAYRNKERPHDNDKPGGVLDDLAEGDLQDILAYLTSIQPKD